MKILPFVISSMVLWGISGSTTGAAAGVLPLLSPSAVPMPDVYNILVQPNSDTMQILTQPAVLDENGLPLQPRFMIAPPYLFNNERERRRSIDVGSLDFGTDMFPTW
jgi:hypothetical protein